MIRATAIVMTWLAISIAPAAAQEQVAIGTMSQGTSGYSMATAIAKVLEEKTDLGAVVQPTAGTSAYLPLVQTGELDFGIANEIETAAAIKGEEPFSRTLDNLRVVGALYPFRVGIFVRDDSDIQSVADLKGKRVTYGFTNQVTLAALVDAILANAGLTPDDIEPVLVPNVVRGAEDFASGNADAAFFAIGSGKVAEVDAAVGGIRFLPLSTDPEDVQAVNEVVPQVYIADVEPGPALAGIDEPTPSMAYDYMLLAGTHVADDVVREVTETVAQSKEELASSFAGFKGMNPERMAKPMDVPYHEGAIAYYESQGLWPPKEQ